MAADPKKPVPPEEPPPRPRKKREVAEETPGNIPMTPMIDVVFQLLIFFMLTMKFPELEGKLLNYLPKDKGLMAVAIANPELEEARIFICADQGAQIQLHRNNKGKHEEEKKNGEVCAAFFEKVDMGRLYMTEKFPEKAQANRNIYIEISKRVKEMTPPSSKDSTKKAPVILDADSEVPFEHIIGVLNACKEQGIDNVEFVGNPRFQKLAGSGAAPGK